MTLDPAGGPARPRAARVCAVVASCTCATPLGSGRFHPRSSPRCLGVLPVTLGLARGDASLRKPDPAWTPRGDPALPGRAAKPAGGPRGPQCGAPQAPRGPGWSQPPGPPLLGCAKCHGLSWVRPRIRESLLKYDQENFP